MLASRPHLCGKQWKSNLKAELRNSFRFPKQALPYSTFDCIGMVHSGGHNLVSCCLAMMRLREHFLG
jgi:hypothetical protein